MKASDLQRRAQAARKKRLILVSDERYKKVMGRLVYEQVLRVPTVQEASAPVSLEAALWVGEFEPVVLELLPSLLVLRPEMFAKPLVLPEDLKEVIGNLKRGKSISSFRGVSSDQIQQWMRLLPGASSSYSVMRSYRWTPSDLRLLSGIQAQLQCTETEVLRKAIEHFYRSLRT